MPRVHAAFAAALCAAFPSSAHVTLDQPTAIAGAYYKAVLRVPHGCSGAPTQRLRVQIPDGAIGAKPQPKPGWSLQIVRGPLAEPYQDHGRTVSEGVREVAWSGGSLPDEQYDEFVVWVRLPDRPGTALHFPTVQECATGVHRWIEIPAGGKSRDDYREPAPHLTLTPKP